MKTLVEHTWRDAGLERSEEEAVDQERNVVLVDHYRED